MKRYHIDYNSKEKLSYADFDNLRLIQIGRRFCDAGEIIEDHLHLEHFELTVVTGGEAYVYSNGKGTLVASGDVYLSLPSDVHRIISGVENPLRYDFFSFVPTDEGLTNELDKIAMMLRSPDARVFIDERIQTLVSIAIAEMSDEKQPLFQKELLSCLLNEIVIRTIRDCNGKKQSVQPMHATQPELLCQRVMNYIDTHVFSLRSLNQLSEVTNYNYSYLSALFKRITGGNLSDYFKESKLKKARLLLRDEKAPSVTELAERLGYSSVYVFSRAYKNHFGVSPSVDKGNKKTITPHSANNIL